MIIMRNSDYLPASGCVPDVGVTGVVGGNLHRCCQEAPVRTERDELDRRVVRQTPDLVSAGYVPNASRLVPTPGCKVPAVGTERDRLNDIIMLQRRDLTTRGDLSHLRCPPADCGYQFSVGADHNRCDPPMPAERKKKLWKQR